MRTPDLAPVLSSFDLLDDGHGLQPAETLQVTRLSGGLINDTFGLGRQFILQRLHRIFRPEVNLDIAALTPILSAAGVPVPAIVPTSGGQPWMEIADPDDPLAGAWRILTRLPGDTLHQLQNLQQAHHAGQMVARFHTALRDCPHVFHFSRPGAHNTHMHFANLAAALERHTDHRLHAQVAELTVELRTLWRAWGEIPTLPERIIHGDLKVSNLLFTGDEVVGVIDLDTMARSTLDVELGDALRSWCNRATEDDPAPYFDLETYRAARQGYLDIAGEWLTADEQRSIGPGIERICLELAARFAGDALNESYFGWNPDKFAKRGEHNLARARNQLALAAQVANHRADL
jgi:aminoglycoside phosphotransferase (APT) family kinase protein